MEIEPVNKKVMDRSPKKMTEVHFSGLPSQSNIYGMTTLTMGDVNSVLVSCLQRNIFCIEYARSSRNVTVPSSREIHFTYLPEGADVVAIDAFGRPVGNSLDIIIGIAFVRSGDCQPSKQYLNIYSQGEPGSGLDLDKIAQGCQNLELGYIPYQLTHAALFPEKPGQKSGEMVFLLSGCDRQIHLLREDKSHQSYGEASIRDHFPEFADVPDVVLRVALEYTDDRMRRVSAVGCESGLLRVAVAEFGDSEIRVVSSWALDLDSPLSVIRLFQDATSMHVPEFLENAALGKKEEPSLDAVEVHLLVGSTLGPSLVYRNVLNRGLGEGVVLPHAEGFDAVTCGCVADIDFDGIHEVVLGTYGQEVLVYKLEKAQSGGYSYALHWQQTVSHPVLSVRYLDITGDGVRELLVLSSKGLHILQHDVQEAAQLCIERIRMLTEAAEPQECR